MFWIEGWYTVHSEPFLSSMHQAVLCQDLLALFYEALNKEFGICLDSVAIAGLILVHFLRVFDVYGRCRGAHTWLNVHQVASTKGHMTGCFLIVAFVFVDFGLPGYTSQVTIRSKCSSSLHRFIPSLQVCNGLWDDCTMIIYRRCLRVSPTCLAILPYTWHDGVRGSS